MTENLITIFFLNKTKIKINEEIAKLRIIALDSMLKIIIDDNKNIIGKYQYFLNLTNLYVANKIAIPVKSEVTKKLGKNIELNAPFVS